MLRPSTYFSLMAEFGPGDIPVTLIGKKYFGCDEQKSKNMATKNQFPFYVFRTGSQKTIWMVDMAIFADYLDKVKAKAQAEFKASKSDG